MSRIEERMPELSTRIVGGLGVLLLSPTVLTAASRCRLELAEPTPGPTTGPPPTNGPKPAKAPESTAKSTPTSGPKPAKAPEPTTGSTSAKAARPAQTPTVTAGPRQGGRSPGTGSQQPGAPRRGLRTWIAVTASGLAAATSVVYTAPGTPWAQADVFSAASAQAEAAHDGDDPAMGHDETTYSGIIRSATGTVLVDATPVKVGINTLAVTVLDPKGAPAAVDQWSATASLPEAGIPDVPVPLKGFGTGVAAADADLPVAGKWNLTVTVRIAGADPTSFTHIVPIAAP